MTVVQTILVFVAIPLAAYVVLAGLIMTRRNQHTGRYQAGKPWTGPAVWYRGHPKPGEHAAPAIHRPALTAGEASAQVTVDDTLKGGASGSW